jgi:hypothetical protein
MMVTVTMTVMVLAGFALWNQMHPAFRTVAGFRLPYLRMHGAGVNHLGPMPGRRGRGMGVTGLIGRHFGFSPIFDAPAEAFGTSRAFRFSSI